MTFFDGHICSPPKPGRAHWWTCDRCGQLWRIENKQWRLTGPEGPAPMPSTVRSRPTQTVPEDET